VRVLAWLRSRFKLGWLPAGASYFQVFNLKPRNQAARGVAWDGTYLLIGQGPHFHQFELVDGYGVRIDLVPASIDDRAYLVLGNRLVTGGYNSVSIFRYPTGTAPIKTFAVTARDPRLAISPAIVQQSFPK